MPDTDPHDSCTDGELDDFVLETSPVTLVELEGECRRHAFLPGRINAGAEVPCPDGDHEHRVLAVLHTEVAENVRIIE